MDRKDEQILNELQTDGRKSYRQLAKELKLAPATVASRVRKLEKKGIITGYSARVDHSKLGKILALIEISIEGSQSEDLEEKIGDKKEILLFARISGQSDLILLGRFESVDHLNFFVTGLLSENGIAKTNTRTIFTLSENQF